MKRNKQTRMVTCVSCNEGLTRSKFGICASCRPRVEPSERPEMPCLWCGYRTKGADRICRSCRPLDRLAKHVTSSPGDGLERGTWHPRPGGIKVWIPWDEVAA